MLKWGRHGCPLRSPPLGYAPAKDTFPTKSAYDIHDLFLDVQ